MPENANISPADVLHCDHVSSDPRTSIVAVRDAKELFF
jgi:hypothetical protein